MLQLRVLPHLLWREEMMGRSLFSCYQVPWLHTSVSIGWMLHSDDGKVPSPCKCDACSPTCGTNPAHFGEYFAAANILCFPSSLLLLFLTVTGVTLRWNSTAHLLPTRVLSCWCLLFPVLCTAHLERGVLVCCMHLTSSPQSPLWALALQHQGPALGGLLRCQSSLLSQSSGPPLVHSAVFGIANLLQEKLSSNSDFPLISLLLPNCLCLFSPCLFFYFL